MAERDWSVFARPNPDGSAFGQRGLPSIRPHGWSSKTRGIRCLRCTCCGKRFFQRNGTPFYCTQLPEERHIALAELTLLRGERRNVADGISEVYGNRTHRELY